MSNAAPQAQVSYADYLALERSTDRKHEWLDGQVYAMAGGTIIHNQISAQVIGELLRLYDDRPCRVYTSDQKIRVRATGLATYADAVVVCGEVQVDPDDPHAITNPVLIVEVLSDSTEGYDRTEKFRHYKRIPSLRDYVLVSQHEALIEVYSRDGARRWSYEDVETEIAPLTAIEGGLDLARVYRNVALEPLPPRA